MAMPTNPGSSKAYGRINVIYVPTIASIAAPTVAEITGATSLDLSCYLFESTALPKATTNLVNKVRRLCDTLVFQQIGETNYEGGTLVYSMDPQSAAGSNGLKAWEKFGAGDPTATTSGFLVVRAGIVVSTTPIATHKVNVYPVEIGPGDTTVMGEGEQAENAGSHMYAITGTPALNKAIAS